jgi:XTP/dITP diphosphohydrolase
MGKLSSDPIRTQVAAVSCGFHQDTAVLDLDYAEDSNAGSDGNFVLTADGAIVEAQLTREGATFDEEGPAPPAPPRPDRLRRDLRGPAEGLRPVKRIGGKLVIATHNAGKLREIRALVAPFGIECLGAAELDLPEPGGDRDQLHRQCRTEGPRRRRRDRPPALSDDSGLSVDALAANPVSLRRWAEDETGRRDFGHAMAKVEAHFAAAGPDAGRDAHFTCALSLAWPDGQTESFEGKVFGHLVWPPRGRERLRLRPAFIPTATNRPSARWSRRPSMP